MIRLKIRGPKIPVNLSLAIRQLIYLSIIGKLLFKISITWYEIIFILVIGVLFEHIFIYIKDNKLTFFSLSSLNTSLSTAIMMGSTNILVYPIAIFIGLLQKYLIKIEGKHFLNPSNIAILVGMIFFSKTTFINSAPLGETTFWWVAFLVIISAALILKKAKLLIIPVSYAFFFVVLHYFFHTRNFREIIILLLNGNLILYMFYMLGDPRSIPSTRSYLIIYTFLSAYFNSILILYWGMKDINIFLALFMSQLLVPIWRFLESKKLKLPINFKPYLTSSLILITIITYFSPINYIRNIHNAFSTNASTTNTSPVYIEKAPFCENQELLENLWQNTDKELYKTEWENSHILKREYNQQEALTNNPFTAVRNSVSDYLSVITPEYLWEDFVTHAPLTAGDINHDGKLDLVLGKIGNYIRVLINDGDNQFTDITGCIFEKETPRYIEYINLADFNSDGWLDLLVAYSQYKENKPNKLFIFDPDSKTFKKTDLYFGEGKSSIGGISVYDLNQDKILDFYVSWGVDWHSQYPNFLQQPYMDEFYMSSNNSWENKIAEAFPDVITKTTYNGMTALFSDFNNDNYVDFLLGNDGKDPSITLEGNQSGFKLIKKEKLENNTVNSMSYFPVDIDNDGTFELWENGISKIPFAGKISPDIYQSSDNSLNENELNRQLGKFITEKTFGTMNCSNFTNYIVISFCNHEVHLKLAIQKNDKNICNRISSLGYKAECMRNFNIIAGQETENPLDIRYDSEKFPKLLKQNVLLKYDEKNNSYFNAIKNIPDAQYTGWTWSAYPFDVDNNSLIDLYIANGYVSVAHNLNRLLMNYSNSDKIVLKDESRNYGVDLEDDGRAIIISDFDGNGTGEIIVNSFFGPPIYFKNNMGGRSITVELRSKNSNYYAVGAKLELITDKGIMLREINQGGIWNTGQPFVQHFGLGNDKIDKLEITWPNGNVQIIDNIKENTKYIIYE